MDWRSEKTADEIYEIHWEQRERGVQVYLLNKYIALLSKPWEHAPDMKASKKKITKDRQVFECCLLRYLLLVKFRENCMLFTENVVREFWILNITRSLCSFVLCSTVPRERGSLLSDYLLHKRWTEDTLHQYSDQCNHRRRALLRSAPFISSSFVW